jgi:hypothetical protein
MHGPAASGSCRQLLERQAGGAATTNFAKYLQEFAFGRHRFENDAGAAARFLMFLAILRTIIA